MPPVVLALIVVLLSGCTVALKRAVPYEHIIMLDSNGIAVDPTGNRACRRGERPGDPPYLCNGRFNKVSGYRKLTDSEYANYIDRMLSSLERSGRTDILIFVHGGMNTQLETIERAVYFVPEIERSGVFPIFVNWRSSFRSNYFEHLLFVRQGEYWKATGWLFAPVYFAVDLTRSIARSPLVHHQMFRSDRQSRRSSAAEVNASAAAERLKLGQKQQPRQAIEFIGGEDVRTPGEMRRSAGIYVATIPTKLLTATLIDMFGTNAWGTMMRRTQTAYLTDREFYDEASIARSGNSRGDDPMQASGGLSEFLRHLTTFIRNHPSGEWKITLIGHSMGTIILNEMVRDFAVHPESEALPIRNIVYMAAACTLRDYEETMFPYLRQHPEVNLYHLVLHPAAEVQDRVLTKGWDFPPRGSLLVWIDNFLGSPVGPLDRTAGRFVNLMAAIHDTDVPIRKQIHIREFSVGNAVSREQPQQHGDFDKFDFWRPECWMNVDRHTRCYDPQRLPFEARLETR